MSPSLFLFDLFRLNEWGTISGKTSDAAPSTKSQLNIALYCTAGKSATASNKRHSVLTYKGVVDPAVQTVAQNIDGNQSNLKL